MRVLFTMFAEDVGLLNEARYFLYFEETDWCRRAKDAGLQVWYCAEAEVVHLEGRAAATVATEIDTIRSVRWAAT